MTIGEALYDYIQTIDRSETRLPLSELATKYIIHKDGKPASWVDHAYLIEPMNDLHPRQCIRKGAQEGITSMYDWKTLMLAKRYGARISIQVSFPTSHRSEEHSQTRFNAIVNNSPAIARLVLVTDQTRTVKQVFAARVKVLNGCTIYFHGRSGEKQVISVDTNVVFIDERDFDKRDDKIAMLEARTGHDFVFRTESTKGIIVHYSTPSMPGYGIDRVFMNSDQRFFFITCTRCGHEYVNKFDADCVHGFYNKGEDKYKGEIYWRCPKCRRRLDLAEVGYWSPRYPLDVKFCHWIATKPENSQGYDGWHGRHIGKPDCAFRWVSPKELLNSRDDPEKYGKYENTFYNMELGLPHMGSNLTVSTEVLEQKNIKPDIVIWKKAALNTIMGCDQGCWLVVGEKIFGSESESFPNGRYGIIHIEHIHEDIAFDTVLDRDEAREGLLSQRIREFGCNIVVIDDQPNTAVSRRLAQKFNDGAYKKYGTTIWRIISSKTNQTKDYVYEEDEKTVSENRTKSIDEMFGALSNIEILFPAKGKLSQMIDTTIYKNQTWDMLDLLFDHLRKETKISKMPDHLDPEQNATVMRGNRSFGNYIVIGDGQNHLLHALKMFRIGIDIKKHFGNAEIILPYIPVKEFYINK